MDLKVRFVVAGIVVLVGVVAPTPAQAEGGCWVCDAETGNGYSDEGCKDAPPGYAGRDHCDTHQLCISDGTCRYYFCNTRGVVCKNSDGCSVIGGGDCFPRVLLRTANGDELAAADPLDASVGTCAWSSTSIASLNG